MVADRESHRRVNLEAEWKLNPELLQSALREVEVEPEVDLFASRMNAQMQRFMSFRPDPAAEVTDAFSVAWKDSKLIFMLFPHSV